MPKFHLRFPVSQVPEWAARYDSWLERKPVVSRDERALVRKIGPAVQKRGYFTKREFLVLCRWKSPRRIRWCKVNSEDYIKAVTSAALSNSNERFRIEALTLLTGVLWPTASVMLHFGSKTPYPILDFRALWSLKQEVPKQYDFQFWDSYVACCRDLAKKAKTGMRELDKALWQYSRERQPKKM